MATFDYREYLHAEWVLFSKNPKRTSAALATIKGRKVSCVLDVGCGAGQEMIPFVVELGALGVGLDISPVANRAGRELFQTHYEGARVAFIRGSAEDLPLRSETCDVVICRIALPYMDNKRALAEMARVLCPNGVMLLRIHHALYYADLLLRSVAAFDVRSIRYALRVLAAGTLYHLTGRQARIGLNASEVFQTRSLLQRQLFQHGLSITGEMPDSTSRAPSFVITKPGLTPNPFYNFSKL